MYYTELMQYTYMCVCRVLLKENYTRKEKKNSFVLESQFPMTHTGSFGSIYCKGKQGTL